MKWVLGFLSLFVISQVAVAISPCAEFRSLLEPIQTLEASFQQTVRSEQGRVLQQSSGKVRLKKPAQFRWEVLGKESRLVIADGKNVWDYDKDLEQVTVQKLTKGQTKAPIFFLTGDVKSLDKDFKITLYSVEKGTCMQGCDTCFELIPQREEGAFQWIRIGFKNKVLKEMELLDQLGQQSQFIFKAVKLNKEIPISEFRFIPPAGVDVLTND